MVSGQFTCSVLRDAVVEEMPWLPLLTNRGIERPGTVQKEGPKTALMFWPCCCRSP